MKENLPSNHKQHAAKNTTILLINLGTPDAPTPSGVRRFLRQFLSDRRVIEIPRWLWWPILYFFILPFRPRRVAKKYHDIWQPQGSPLLYQTKNLQQQLHELLQERYGKQVNVVVAMRYGNPSVQQVMQQLQQQTVKNLIVLPLYPQYAASTTASAFDAVSQALQQWRFLPHLTLVNSYHDFPLYIQLVAQSIKKQQEENGKPDKLLISFHGLPKRCLTLGDPYYCLCHKTARLVAQQLQLSDNEWRLVFQSRFGKAQWLQPYCEQTLIELATAGCKVVDVICPGFAVDCLETLEEIQQTYATTFIAAGGKQLRYIPALNSQSNHANMLAELLTPHLESTPC